MHDLTPLLPWAGLLLGLLCLGGAFHAGRRWRLVEDLPASKTTGVFIGLVELQGHGRNGPAADELPRRATLRAIIAGASRSIGRERSPKATPIARARRRPAPARTAAGRRSAQRRRDDTFLSAGRLRRDPRAARGGQAGTGGDVFDETCSRGDPLYYGSGPAQSVADSDHRRRFSESGIPQHARYTSWARPASGTTWWPRKSPASAVRRCS